MKNIENRLYPEDRNFIRNSFGLSSAEFIWGLAIPVIFESAFLQIFLREIGASNKIVGLVPSILAVCIMSFSIFSAWFTSHLDKKKPAVIVAHIAASLPFLIFGILMQRISRSHLVYFFIVSYVLFSLVMGLLLPLWQNFIVKIFHQSEIVKANSIMFSAQIFGRLIGSFFIFRSIKKYSFSIESASMIFILTGILFFTGSFFFLIIREPSSEITGEPRNRHNISSIIKSMNNVFRNRNYMKYLAGTIETYGTIAVLSFYANYAVEYNGIGKDTAAGLFVAFIYAAGVLSNVLLGWFNLLSFKSKFITARLSAISGTIILLFAGTLPIFLAASFLFGISRGINQSAHAPAVKRLSGQRDATDYFAISAILVFPISFSVPLLSGTLIDLLSVYGSFSYVAVFVILAAIQITGLLFTISTDFDHDI